MRSICVFARITYAIMREVYERGHFIRRLIGRTAEEGNVGANPTGTAVREAQVMKRCI